MVSAEYSERINSPVRVQMILFIINHVRGRELPIIHGQVIEKVSVYGFTTLREALSATPRYLLLFRSILSLPNSVG